MRHWAFVLALVVVGCTSAGGVPPANVPPGGAVWFGQSFDPQTIALTGQATSFTAPSQIAIVAHLSRPSTGETVSTW